MKRSIVRIAWGLTAALLLVSCRSDGWLISREVKKLEGRSEAQLVEEYGASERVHVYKVAEFAAAPEPDRLPAPRILALYPAAEAGNLDVPIRRLSWQRGRVLLTAWLHQEGGQWRVLYAEEHNLNVIE